jgi:hypothetical protein
LLTPTRSMPPPSPAPAKAAADDGDRGRKRNRGCWTCGSVYHVQARCPQEKTHRPESVRGEGECERCGGRNHRAAECRARKPRSSSQAGEKPLN